jgi:DNA polymerase V
MELHHLAEYRSAKLRVYFLTSPKRTHPKRLALIRTVDRLNLRFGRDTVTFAAAGIRRPWKMSRGFLLPWYTTAWDELLPV